MSSRSLAAARSRRAGENPPPVSGNRPITSIGSQAAFAPQPMPPGFQYNMPPPPNNVRTSRNQQQQQQQQQNAYQQVQQSQQQVQNGLPFSKLSISDAIGLITLRLGRVEKWVIETENENAQDDVDYDTSNIPVNSKIIDNSVFNGILNRIETLEKVDIKTISNSNHSSEDIIKLSEDVKILTEQLTRIGDEGIKHNLLLSKHTEQLFKFERELVETKDILKTFMIKHDLFSSEINIKFSDYEYAISELEKNCLANNDSQDFNNELQNLEQDENNSFEEENSKLILSVDLKNIINQELASLS